MYYSPNVTEIWSQYKKTLFQKWVLFLSKLISQENFKKLLPSSETFDSKPLIFSGNWLSKYRMTNPLPMFGVMKYSCLLQTLFMFQNCNRYIDSITYNILYVKHMRSEKVYKWIASMFEHTIIPQHSLAHSYSSTNKLNTNKTFEEKKWE